MVRNTILRRNGITLVALVITIVILIILATVAINFTFGENGLITMANIAKNESEVSTLKESLNMYYMSNRIERKDKEPIRKNVLKEDIKDKKTLEKIVGFQYGVDSIDQIRFESLYYLDMAMLGLTGVKEERYFMDIDTRIVYINEGILLSSGMTYVLEEKDILPVKISAEETGTGFKLKASMQEERKIQSYDFYINNELYKTVATNEKNAVIEVNDKGFEILGCMVKANGAEGRQYISTTISVENYIIKNAEDFNMLRAKIEKGNNFAGKKIRIVQDINMGGSETNRTWIPIGNETTAFSGILEGNNNKILNLYNKNITENNQGLIGYAENATIQNIIIESGNIQGNKCTGAILGRGKNVNIINCTNNALIKAQKGNAGGITGKIEENGNIQKCLNNAEVCSTEYVNEGKDTFIGGIIGDSSATITECVNYGNITGVYSAVGGITGESFKDILNCENNGKIEATSINVNSDSTMGGISGYIKDCKIGNCSNLGKVIGEGDGIGGIVGICTNGQVINCKNKNEITVNKGIQIGGIVGLIGGNTLIDKCLNIGTINSIGVDKNKNSLAGGIVGESYNGLIKDCINQGNVTSNGAYIGGIVGNSFNSIIGCENKGTVIVENSNQDNNACAGGIAGQVDNNINANAEIISCINNGNVQGNGNHVGGITAAILGGTIKDSHNTGEVSSSTGVVGGIAAAAYTALDETVKSIIENCFNTGNITANGIAASKQDELKDSYVGGITGGNHGVIRKCWNEGKVTGISAIGGIAGNTLYQITDCYNKGVIISTGKNIYNASTIGGIAGALDKGEVSNCYNRGNLVANYIVVGGVLGQMQENTRLSNSYNTFRIMEEPSNNRAMLVGLRIGKNTIENCYYLGDTTSDSSRTEADMKTTEFIELIGGTSYWKLDTNNVNNGFVILKWQ